MLQNFYKDIIVRLSCLSDQDLGLILKLKFKKYISGGMDNTDHWSQILKFLIVFWSTIH